MFERLRNFTKESIRKDCRDLTGLQDNALFYECEFDKLKGLTLQNCDLNRSKFLTSSVRDALGFTLTLSCLSFRNVEYSPLLFDLLLALMTLTTGNDVKREKLLDVIGRERAAAIHKVLRALE
jgi:hypothetical protein